MPGPYTPNVNDVNRPFDNDEVQYGAPELRAIKSKIASPFALRTAAVPATLLNADCFGTLLMSNGGSVTVPLGLTTIPGWYNILTNGDTLVIAAVGVSITVPDGLSLNAFGAGSTMLLICTAANTYYLSGDLAFAVT